MPPEQSSDLRPPPPGFTSHREPHYSQAFCDAIADYTTGDIAARDERVETELTLRLGHTFDFLAVCAKYLDLRGRRFIEVGCGSGFVAVAAASLGAVATATDLMPRCIELTEMRFREHELDAEVFRSDLRDPLPGGHIGAFDFVWCYQVLEHMPRADQFRALVNLLDMVAPGGFLFLDTENALCPYDGHDTQLWLYRLLKPEYQRQVVQALGKAIDYYEPSFGAAVPLHDYLSYDEVVGAAATRGFTVVNPFMPHDDGRQYMRVVSGSDWLYDSVLKYFPIERFSPISVLLRKA